MLRTPTTEELAAIARLRGIPREQRAAQVLKPGIPVVGHSTLIDKVVKA